MLFHVISAAGIETDPEKTEAVRNWPVPERVEDLRTFLGFTGYYRRFIPNYAKQVRPLNDLIKRASEKEWEWTEECQKAFKQLVETLSSTLVLSYPDFTKSFVLNTDASMDGLGATLSQVVDGKERVIGYASRALRKSEKNYPVHKLEFLSLKWAVTEKFHDYLYGNTFIVRTDNNPLTYVTTTAKLDATGHRWLSPLSNYNFDIEYRPGKKNADERSLTCVLKNDSIKAICQSLILVDYGVMCNESFIANADGDHVTSNTVPNSQEPLPTLDPKTLCKLQEEDRVIGKVKSYLRKERKPTKKDVKMKIRMSDEF